MGSEIQDLIDALAVECDCFELGMRITQRDVFASRVHQFAALSYDTARCLLKELSSSGARSWNIVGICKAARERLLLSVDVAVERLVSLRGAEDGYEAVDELKNQMLDFARQLLALQVQSCAEFAL